MKINPGDSALPHHNFTLFREIFKVKKSSHIIALLVLTIVLSAVPLSVAFKSYVWERHRALIGEGNLLYDLFVIEEFMRGSEGGEPETIRGRYIVPTLRMKTYVVKKGDSLFSVAKRFSISIDAILSINNMRDASILRIGTVLKIPNMNGVYYSVRKGDSLSSITTRYRVDMNKLVDVNELESSVIYVGQKLFIPGAALSNWERAEALGTLFKYPARGRLTSRLGFRIDPFTKRRAYHAGIDIANRIGTPVHASQSGKVIFSGYKGTYGKTVILSHQQGYSTVYGHLDKILVKKGQVVRQGDKIGTVGNTGRSTGPHLHFEIQRHRRIIDPLKLLHR
ncbi:MAG: M23 family metallopeptidase [Spirochaetes bacterium]|nr:M23 family metallopeptidase [Spirochaetota bacterium]